MRMIISLVVLVCLLAPGARAQATADQLNKLSLESLTATPPRGSGGGGYAPAHRPAYHGRYASPPHRSAYSNRHFRARSRSVWRRPHHGVAPRPHWRPRPHWSRPAHRASPYTPRFYRR